MGNTTNSNGNYQTINTGIRFFNEVGPNGESRPSLFVKNLRIPKSAIEKGTESTTQSGTAMLRINAPFVNVKEKFKEITGVEPFTTHDTSWIQLTFWRDQVKWFKEWALSEDMPAQVEIALLGSWRVSEYTGQDGSPKKALQINVTDFAKITKRRGNSNSAATANSPAGNQHSSTPQQAQQVPAGVMDDFEFLSEDDGELPF